MLETIYLIYEISENPYLKYNSNNKEAWTYDATRPTEANDIIRLLLELDYNVKIVDGAQELIDRKQEIMSNNGIVFNIGRGVKEGLEKKILIPALCDFFSLPYVGPTGYATTLGRNKFHSNCILKSYEVNVPSSHLIHNNNVANIDISLPVIIKPNNESNSIGISSDSILTEFKYLREKVSWVQKTFNQPALIESFINGQEFSVAVLGNGEETQAIGVIENIIDGKSLCNKVIQRSDNINRKVKTRPLNDYHLKKKLSEIACEAHNKLLGRDFSRVDFRLSQTYEPFLIEFEHQPDLGVDSAYIPAGLQTYHSAKEIINAIIGVAKKRFSQQI